MPIDIEAAVRTYRQWAARCTPLVHAALKGKREVPQQREFAEAWISYALFLKAAPLSLQEVIETADYINHLLVSPDEISWAFLRLRKRGWLAEQGDTYGLTPEGRRAIEGIVGSGGVYVKMERLEDWTVSHPP